MKIIQLAAASKDFLLYTRVGILLKPFHQFLRFLSNFSLLTSWVRKNSRLPLNDFYKPKRRYADREKLYKHVVETRLSKGETPIYYLEFGVAEGNSFRWWVTTNTHSESKFWGFDTFEGLPENWNFYSKGAMSHDMLQLPDHRCQFIKGLFQDTLYGFLKDFNRPEGTTIVLHMDADLYSSTLFALTMLAPYLRSGDIILFDEFNVPNHEFAAWNDFVRSYYIQFEILGAVNNYYQVAFQLK